jgi:hypothetical protein
MVNPLPQKEEEEKLSKVLVNIDAVRRMVLPFK